VRAGRREREDVRAAAIRWNIGRARASNMTMTRTLLAAVMAVGALAGVAHADGFGGVAGNEKTYLVGRDRVCVPLVVTAGKATGAPACHAAPTEEVAGLSLKTPPPERGSKAAVTVAAKGSTLTVSAKDGGPLVTWTSFDPIASVVDVWRSTYGRLVVVEYTVRRGGREVHDVVGFDLGVGGGGAGPATGSGTGSASGSGPATGSGSDTDAASDREAPPADPAVGKLVVKARKARGKAAIAAWAKVLALDPDHAEAIYRTAVARASTKQGPAALDGLEALVRSRRTDAPEWLVEARGEKAFKPLYGDPRFRAAVGLDRKAGSVYERVMGMGGVWEQTLVPCEQPEIVATFTRDRVVRMTLRTACEGSREKGTYKGTWVEAHGAIDIRLPKPGGGHDVAPCQLVPDGDEDKLTCQLDEDLELVARPVRR
jgi:hypothetical protein